MSTPIFQIPSVLPFLSLPSQSTSPFTSQQQNILISVANSLTSFSNVGSLTVDLYSASNTLATNGTSFTNLASTFIALSKISVLSSNPTGANNALSDLINAENKLSSSGTNLTTFVTNLVGIIGVSSQLNTLGNDSTLISNLSTLNSFLSSPGSFIFSSLPTGLQNLGNDSTLTSNLKTLNSFLSGPSTFILNNLPSNLITLNNDSTFFSKLSTLNSFLSTPASFIFNSLPTGLQNLGNDSTLTSNLSTLNSLLSNPANFIFNNLSAGLKSLSNDSILNSNLNTLNSFLFNPGGFILNDLPTPLITLNNDNVFFSSLNTLDNFLSTIASSLVSNYNIPPPFNSSASPLNTLLSYATIPWTIIKSAPQTIGQFTNISTLNGNSLMGFLDLVGGNPANDSSTGEYVLGEYIKFLNDNYMTSHAGPAGNYQYGGGWMGFILALLSNINSDIGDAMGSGWTSSNTILNHPEDITKIIVWSSGIFYAIYQILSQLIAATQQAMTYTQFFNGGLNNFHGGSGAIPFSKITNVFSFPPAGF